MDCTKQWIATTGEKKNYKKNLMTERFLLLLLSIISNR